MSSNNPPIQVTCWTEERLIDLCEFINRGKAPQYVIQSSVKAIGQRCVREKFQGNEARFQDQKKIEGHLFAKKGDVLLNSTGTGTIGRSCVFDEDIAYIVDGHVTVVRPYQQKCSSSLLNSLLKTSQYQRYFEIYCYTGSTNQIELSSAAVAGVKLCLPSRNEQQAIADILSTVDEAIGQTEAVIAKLQQVKAGMLHDLLTRGLDENGELRDPIHHPELFKESAIGRIPKSWEIVLLDEIATRGSGHTPNKNSPSYWYGGVKWVSLADSDKLDMLYLKATAKEISKIGLANSSAVLHPKGTVIVSRDAGVGKSAILAESMAVSQHFIVWACGPHLNNIYLYYWLQMNKARFEAIAIGSTIKTIGLGYFKKLRITVPPRYEQDRITEILISNENLLSNEEKQLIKFHQIKQGLMQDLLTGTIRVPQHLQPDKATVADTEKV
jgi:type I restriction enzyme, S subunit